jgi:hypothetical protein
MYLIAIILFVTVSYPVLAEEERNCDPRAGLTDGSCYIRPEAPWWQCKKDTYYKQPVTPEQQQRLENFGLDLFSPKASASDRVDRTLSRSDLIKRFGRPLGTRSKKVPRNQQDPYDKGIWEVTTWEYPGFRITTAADESTPDTVWIEDGEVFDAKVSFGHGVRVGQSIERWARQFGRPECRDGVPPFSQDRLAYQWESNYFACTEDKAYRCAGAYQVELYLDASGEVRRMTWSHAPMH